MSVRSGIRARVLLWEKYGLTPAVVAGAGRRVLA